MSSCSMKRFAVAIILAAGLLLGACAGSSHGTRSTPSTTAPLPAGVVANGDIVVVVNGHASRYRIVAGPCQLVIPWALAHSYHRGGDVAGYSCYGPLPAGYPTSPSL
jgi:hypothetical protein